MGEIMQTGIKDALIYDGDRPKIRNFPESIKKLLTTLVYFNKVYILKNAHALVALFS